MTQELRERVARAIVEADVTPEGSVADLMSCPGYMKNIYGFADAAIAIIRAETLEEAARVAEENAASLDYPSVYMGGPSRMAKMKVAGIADAIRALKEKP